MANTRVKHGIFYTVTGSRLYGNSRPDSDWDFRGVYISPLSKYFGFVLGDSANGGKGTESDPDQIDNILRTDRSRMIDEDVEFYDIKKFFAMATKSNPNILELLYADNLIVNPYWDLIRKHRHKFLSIRAKHSFSGYAFAQLKRLKNHKVWAGDCVEEPKRSDFDLSEVKEFNNSQIKALRQFSDEKLREYFKNEETVQRFKREYNFFEAYEKYKHYKEYKENRNVKRHALEAEFGYDCKHASHLVRLFFEARRLLTDHELIFPSPEIDTINAVRNGEWEYEKLIEFAEYSEQELNELAEKSDLPKNPDLHALDELLQEILWDYFSKNI